MKRIIAISALAVLFAGNVHAADPAYQCGGPVEKQVWELWDRGGKDLLDGLIKNRLQKQGDVYALYDFQVDAQSVVAMADRCNRLPRMREVARLVQEAYKKLEPAPGGGRQWVCRGGGVCSDKNKLLNHEVLLDSVQFLGFATTVANAMANSSEPLTDQDKSYIKNTVDIATEHLLRWSSGSFIEILRKAKNAKKSEVVDGGSAMVFSDKNLWLITIYFEMAGILTSPNAPALSCSMGDLAQISDHLRELLQFFNRRLSIEDRKSDRFGSVALADLDRGYWSGFPGNAYAGYEGPNKPLICNDSGDGKHKKIHVVLPAEQVVRRDDIGWDISHARRFVPFIDAVERNRGSVAKFYKIRQAQLPSGKLAAAFANTLVTFVWNGDKDRPLFSNFWSGANGWFLVGYDNATGQCSEGKSPYSMTDSFPTGGYASWARYNPVVGDLGKKLYLMLDSSDPKESSFMLKHYSVLKAYRWETKEKALLQFLPSLVGVSIR